MDTETTNYGNIAKAMKTQSPQQPTYNALQSTSPPQTMSNTSTGLSMSQKAQNYKIFDELMKGNIDLSKILENAKKSEELQKQLDSAKKSEIDSQLFGIMESAVKGEEKVRQARQHASDIKSKILTEMCLKNPEYAEALHEYRRAVNEAYINLKERSDSSSDRGNAD